MKKNIGVICSMSYYEMKLMVNVLTDRLEDNEVMGINTKKSITNLIYRLNDMLTKQPTKGEIYE
jgi:hypothetical protein